MLRPAMTECDYSTGPLWIWKTMLRGIAATQS